jgi:hypothetical protein
MRHHRDTHILASKPDRRGVVSLIVALVAILALAAPAEAAPSSKKAIWGPTRVDGVSQFPIYQDLGVGIYQLGLNWSDIAAQRPQNPTDPADPAYDWPEYADFALSEAPRYGMQVSLMVSFAPSWANGGKSKNWAPKRRQYYADFMTAAARRYPQVKLWMVWGEPSRRSQFMPLARDVKRTKRLTRAQARGPRIYARILDAAYAALKGVDPANVVIGGNTFTTGDISPYKFIRAMKLPNGKPPRLDLYGHNPFTARKPNLRKPPLRDGFADFSDLDTLAGWVDRAYRPLRKRPRLFLSEFFLPTDHQNHEFNFYVSQQTQASWLKAALRIARRTRRIYTLGWFSLYDDPPRPGGDEVNRGLIDIRGRRKPAYYAYRDG